MPKVNNINGEYVIKDVVEDAVIDNAYAEAISTF